MYSFFPHSICLLKNLGLEIIAPVVVRDYALHPALEVARENAKGHVKETVLEDAALLAYRRVHNNAQAVVDSPAQMVAVLSAEEIAHLYVATRATQVAVVLVLGVQTHV